MAAVISGGGLGLFNSSFSQIGKGLGASARYGQGQDSQYVNIATGNLLLQSFDDQVVMRGMTAGFSRTYNSRGTFAGAGSDGWLTGFERRIELIGTLNQAGSVMRRHSGDGSYQDFAFVANDLYRSTVGDGAHDSLRRDGKAMQWIYEEGDTRLEETYADAGNGGRLTRIRDLKSDPAQPTTWNLSYDPQGRVSEVAANDGNGNLSRMQFTYAGANLASVTSYAGSQAVGRVWYGYDTAGRLSTVTHDLTPGKSSDDEWSATAGANDGHLFRTVYSYVDASSLQIASVQHSDGVVVSYTYDALGRVRTLTRGDLNDNDADGQGQTLSFAYDSETRSTRVSDSTGRTWVYYYDESHQLIAAEQPSAGGWQETYTYEYDADGNLTAAMIDGVAGRVYRYDDNGNAIEQREFISSGLRVITRVTERTFNAANQVTSETVYEVDEGDILGRAVADSAAGKNLPPPANALVTRYIYDAANRLRFVVNAAGEVSESEYASAGFGVGRLLKSRQYLDATYTGAYTLAALEAWAGAASRKANSSLTQYSYDAFGSVAWRRYAGVDSAGNGIATDAVLIEGYRYDERGRVIERSASNGADLRRSVYVYDGMGRLLSEKVFDRNAAALQSRSWSYTDSQRLAIAIVEGGAVGDGDEGNDLVRIEQRDAAGQVVLVSQRALAGPTATRETRNLYDRAGLLRAVQDANGGRSYLFYDVERQLVGEVDATGALVEYVRDTFGRIVQTVRYATALDTRAWMPAPPASPNLAQVPTDIALVRPAATAQDRTVTTFYDLLGRKNVETDGEGRVTYFSYDLNDRLIRTRQLPRANAPRNEERITRYFYDAVGRELGRLDAEGYLVKHNYDLAGNRTRTIAFATVVPVNLREATLNEMRPAAAAQDRVTLWFYDGRGNTLAMLDAEGYLTQYQRNERLAQDTTRAFELQLIGLTGSETLATLLSRVQAGGVRETRRGYDALGRLSVQTDPQGTVTRNTYDARGNLVRTQLAADTSEVREGRLRYNVFGELTGQLDGEGTTRLSPDMTQAQIDAVFAQYGTRHSYDGLGRRIESIDAGGHKTWYFYDADGRPTYTVRGLPGASGVLNASAEVSQTRYSAFGDAIETTAYTGVLTLAVPGDRNSVASALTTLAYTAASDSRRTYAYNRRGQLTGATDAELATTRYSYDGYGDRVREERLIGANVALRIDSGYDKRGLLTSRDEAVGSAVARNLSWVYDAFGQSVQSTDARGAIVRFGYDRLGRQITRTQNVSGRDEVVATAYDAYDRVLSELDASGRRTTYVYDTAARSMQVTSDENVSVTTVYNRFGQQQTVTQSLPGGRSAISEFQYDRNGRLLSAMDTLRNESHSEYDARGLLIASTDASGRRVEMRYDPVGRLLRRIEDPAGLNLVTQYEYDGQGRQIRVTDASGKITSHRYDREGRLLETARDPGGINQRTHYAYDALGRQISVTEGESTAAARKIGYEYDALGRRTRDIVDPGGLGLTTDYVYDANDNLIRRYVADPIFTYRSYYDQANRPIYSVDPNGAVTRHGYDAAGREVATRAYLNPIAVSSLSDATSIAQLDALVAASGGDQGGFQVYDRDGRVRFVIDLQNRVSERRYDTAGRLAAELRYAGTLALSAQLLDRLRLGTATAAEIAALTGALPGSDTRVVRHVYDDAGRERYTLVQDGAGLLSVSERRYDESGRVLVELSYGVRIPAATGDDVFAIGNALAAAGGADNSRRRRYVHDGAGRLRYSVDDAGAVTGNEYDEAGRLSVVRRYDGLIAANTQMTETAIAAAVSTMGQRFSVTRYDAAGRVERVGNGLAEERYFYDDSGLLERMLDKNHYEWRYGYDKAGRRITETSPPVRVATIDAAGVVGTSTRKIVTRTVYDALGRVISRIEDSEQPNARVTEYQYDNAGRQTLTRFADAGVIDPVSGVLSFQGTRPTTQVSYDTLGRAVVQKDVLGRYSYKVYDDRGQLLQDIDADGFVTRYAYNGFGERSELKRSASKFNFSLIGPWTPGSAISRAQADAGTVVDPARDRVVRSVYDQRGLLERVEQGALEYFRDDGVSAQGQPTTQFEYDAYGRKVKESVLLQGNRTDANARWADSYFYYDDLDRLVLSVDAEGYLTRNEYYPTGELKQTTQYARAITTAGLSAATPPALPAAGDEIVGFDRVTRFEYDAFGRKVREYARRHYADSAGGSGVREVLSQYDYDDNDRLTQLTTDGVATSTAYDALGHVTSVTEAARRVLAPPSIIDPLLAAGHDLTSDLLYQWRSPFTEMLYDAFGNVIQTRRYANGNVIGGTAVADDARDQVEKVRYDGQGRAVTVFAADGARTFIGYDALDRITDRWSLLTTASEPGGAVRQHEKYTYEPLIGDNASRRVRTQRMRERLDNSFTYTDVDEVATFNAFGEITAKTHGGASGVLTYEYDLAGRLIGDNESGTLRRYGYNLAGQRSREWQSVLGANGAVETALTRHSLDRLGRITASELPAYAADTQLPKPAITRVLDRWGNALQIIDTRGFRTDYRYNEANQVTRDERPLVEVVGENGAGTWTRPVNQWFYDALGRLVATRDANGNTRVNEYDSAGRLIASSDALNQKTRFGFDALGNQRLVQNPLGYLTFKDYDTQGRAVAIGDYLPNAAGLRERNVQQRYTLNQNGDRIELFDAYNNRIGYEYDSRGQLLRSQSATGAVASYKYDSQGRKTYEHNGIDSMTWAYDVQGSLRDHVNLAGRSQHNSYDDITGQLTREDHSGGASLNVANGVRTTTYYPNGRIKAIYEQGSATPAYRYEYDAAGNRTVEEVDTRDDSGRVVHTLTRTLYDSHNRIQRVSTDELNASGGVLKRIFDMSYRFDAVGNRRQVSASSGYGPDVNGVIRDNTRPMVVQPPPSRSLRSGRGAEFSLLFSDVFRDAENNPMTLTVRAGNNQAWPSWLQVGAPDANGRVRFSANPPAGITQSIEVILTATENGAGGLSNAASFFLTVGPNQAPAVIDASLPEVRIKTGQALNRDLWVGDYFRDTDVGDVLRLQFDSITPAASWLTAAADGGSLQLRGTPTAAGDYSLRLRATDADGLSAYKTLRIRVVASTAPTGTAQLPPRSATIGRDFSWSAPLASVFGDADGDRLTINAIGLPNWLSFQQTNEQGQPLLRLAGVVPADVTPDRVFDITFNATDGSGAIAYSRLKITARALNSDPYLSATIDDAQMILFRDGSNSLPPLPAFNDGDGDPVAARVTGLPPGLSFDPVTRRITGTADQLGDLWLDYIGDDGRGGREVVSFRIRVQDNAPPVLPTLAPPAANQHAAYYYQMPEAFDVHAPLSYAVDSATLPPGIVFNQVTREFTGAATEVRDFYVAVSVSDRYGATTTASMLLRVNAPQPNRPPQATPGPHELEFYRDSILPLGSQETLPTDLFVDPDGNPMSYSISGNLAGLGYAFDPQRGHVFTATRGISVGLRNLTLTADDGLGGVTSVTVKINIKSGSPQLVAEPASESDGFSFDMSALAQPQGGKGDEGGGEIVPGLEEIAATVPVETRQYWFTYDAENRLKINNGKLSNGQIQLDVAEPESYELKYDAAGNIVARFRLQRNPNGSILSPVLSIERSGYDLRGNRTIEFHSEIVDNGMSAFEGVRKRFSYDANNRLLEMREYYQASASYSYLLAPGERETVGYGGWLSGAEIYLYDADGRLMSLDTKGRPNDFGWVVGAQNNPAPQFVDLGKLQSKTYVDYRINTGRIAGPGIPPADTRATGYDAAGRLMKYHYSPTADTGAQQTYTYAYYGWDGYQEKTVTGTRPGQAATVNTLSYDAFGRLRSQRENTPGVPDDRMRYYSYNGDGSVLTRREGVMRGEVFTQDGAGAPGNYYFVHGGGQQQAQLREGKQITSGGSSFYSRQIQSLSGLGYYDAGGNTVVVQAGDTLRKLAARVYGTEQLWYLLADANGLGDPDQELVAGTQVIAPNTTVASNDASTFRPYDPAQAIGSTTPNIPIIPTPPKQHCNAVAMVLMVVVAVVVSVVTYGAMTGVASSWLGATGSAMLAGATAGAAGSAASQAVGSAMGVSSFSWRNVAAGAVTGAITGGLAQQFGSVGELLKSGDYLKAAGLAAGSAAAGYVGQKAAGLEVGFSWRSVASSAVSSLISTGASQALGLQSEGLFTQFAAGAVEGVVSLHVRRGFGIDAQVDYGAIALDAFGNALGQSIARGFKRGKAASRDADGAGSARDPASRAERGASERAQRGYGEAETFAYGQMPGPALDVSYVPGFEPKEYSLRDTLRSRFSRLQADRPYLSQQGWNLAEVQNDLIDNAYAVIDALDFILDRSATDLTPMLSLLDAIEVGNSEHPLLKAARVDPEDLRQSSVEEIRRRLGSGMLETLRNTERVLQRRLDSNTGLYNTLAAGAQDLGSTTLPADLVSMLPVLGNVVSAGQVMALEMDKDYMRDLADMGLMSPRHYRRTLDSAEREQASAGVGVALSGIGGKAGKLIQALFLFSTSGEAEAGNSEASMQRHIRSLVRRSENLTRYNAAEIRSAFDLGRFERGVLIEDYIFAAVPGRLRLGNFKTIDGFDAATGHAVSVKSVDLDAGSYASLGSLKTLLKSQVDDLAGFTSHTQNIRAAGDLRTVTINPGDIKSRELVVAYQSSAGTAGHLQAMNDMATYALSKGVQLYLFPVR